MTPRARIALGAFRLPDDLYVGRREERRNELQALFRAAGELEPTHLFLPGWTFVYTPQERQQGEPDRDIAWLAEATRRFCFMGELTQRGKRRGPGFQRPPEGLGVIAIEHGRVLPLRIRQWFATTGEIRDRNERYQGLEADVFGGEHIVVLGGIRFFILVCGESNFMRNSQRRGNEVVSLRQEVDGRRLADMLALDYQVAFNPAHTEMGNDGKMRQRWALLSHPQQQDERRFCFFTTNTDTARCMYAFSNGDEVTLRAKRNWPAGQTWLLDTVDIF